MIWRRRAWAAAIAIGLVALTIETGREHARVSPPSPVPAVDNPGPQGLEAAYRYLAARGQARILEGAFSEIPADARVLITAQPYARAVENRERAALLDWVDRGGTLVVLGEHGAGLRALSGVLEPRPVALHLDEREVGLTELGRDLRALIASAHQSVEVALVPARPALPDPLLGGVRVLAVSPDRGFDPEAGEAVPLLLAGDTPVALSQAHGKGRILALAGPDVFANARIDRGDNLQLLANLAALGPVLFDEGHHHASPDAALAAFVAAFGPPLLAAAFCVLLLAAALGRRLGPRDEAAATPARTARDYAAQLGRMYRNARAEDALARDLASELRAAALRRTHLPPTATTPEIAAALAQLDANAARRFEALAAALESGAPSPARFAELSRAAVAWKAGI